ncbi:Shedu anti-phage system protein SduA domain-containing protein [Methanolobus sp. WCC1]|jgi:hypothetical protein|uniref:Shedu anti-phage system protein SduA domain-containing protein n=1 Tax=unclassified Methanolobus TaxID=2629569 RepID=UPI00324A571B
MDTNTFLSTHPTLEEIMDFIVSLSSSEDASSIKKLRDFLTIEYDYELYSFSRSTLPRLACLGLVQKGVEGIEAIYSALSEAPGAARPRTIIECLWEVSKCKLPLNMIDPINIPPQLKVQPTTEVIETAHNLVKELIIESQSDGKLFYSLLNFASINKLIFGFDYDSFGNEFMNVITESTIKVSQHMINDFKDLIEANTKEEEYQMFLSENPLLIDPLAFEVIPKQNLGTEYVTDYVVRRLDNEYIVVEIEKPSDAIFTKQNDFTAKFTHAFGQVIDFLEWIDNHGEYARSLMPEISSPKGLLIIGLRSNLTYEQQRKLKRYCFNSRLIEVITFDDLLLKATNLYKNIHNVK